MYLIVTKDRELYVGGDIFDNKPNLSNELISLKFPKPIKRAILGNDFIMILYTTGEVHTFPVSNITTGNTITKLIKFPELIVQISLSDTTYAALSGTGKLYMRGFGTYILISGGLRVEYSKPVEISFGTPINFVSVDDKFTIAVSNDGIVNHWATIG